MYECIFFNLQYSMTVLNLLNKMWILDFRVKRTSVK